jgi:hypothetical protein
MFLHNTLITLKDFKINAPQARVFIITAPDKCRQIGELFNNEGAATSSIQSDAKKFKKDKRNCPAEVPKTFALTIKSSIMPLANGSVSPLQEAD